MPTIEALRHRYMDVSDRVAEAARRSGRRPEDIVVVAVTKNAEPDQIRALLSLGHQDLGENQVQQLVQRAAMVEEFLDRHRVLPHSHRSVQGAKAGRSGGGRPAAGAPATAQADADAAPIAGLPASVRWHMIGHLQRNKVRKAVEFCRLVHSVDSLRLVEEIQQVALKREEPIDVLLQVNCSGEASKFGCPPAAVLPMAEQFDSMVYVRLRGLMTMAAPTDHPEQARAAFSHCRELFDEVCASRFGQDRFNILSMGMSGDFEVAIAEGANMVRIGAAIFGDPKPGLEPDGDEG